MSSGFSAPTSAVSSGSFGPPTSPVVAGHEINSGHLSEKTLELTFCSQFAAEIADRHHPIHWFHRITWFGLTQLQEQALGFDAVTSLGGAAVLFQFKASHTVTKKRGRRFKVEHDQMSILRDRFGHRPRTCFYVFPDLGTVADLVAIHSNVIDNTWLIDVASLPAVIPLPFKNNSTELRKDNCHYAHLGLMASGDIEFHSEPFRVRPSKAAKIAGQMSKLDRSPYPDKGRYMPTDEMVDILKSIGREGEQRTFFRNTVMMVLTDRFHSL